MSKPPNATHFSGFTLIEVMVVVAVLGLLMAIAMPAYQGYVNESRIGAAIQEIRQMQLILDDRYLNGDPPATLADVGLGLIDPWGNPYRYLWLRDNPSPAINGQRRRDRSMNPVNTDYDLYSTGADGITAAQFAAGEALDDVVRANDGDFVGLARDH